MEPVTIEQAQYGALNRKGSRKAHASFSAALSKAVAGKPEASAATSLRRTVRSLNHSDFASPDVTLPEAPKPAMRGLEASDFGGARTTALRPLTGIDNVPGARASEKDQTDAERIQTQAEKWVSQTFYGTMLKNMSEGPFKSDLFSGGRGGQAFSPMLAQHLADRMAHASSNKLVRNVVKELQKKANVGRPAAEPQGSVPRRAAEGAAGTANPAANPYKDVRIHVSPDLGA